jgi:hypothetical protein
VGRVWENDEMACRYWGAWLSILGFGYWIPKVPLVWWLLNYNMMMYVRPRGMMEMEGSLEGERLAGETGE